MAEAILLPKKPKKEADSLSDTLALKSFSELTPQEKDLLLKVIALRLRLVKEE